MTIYGRHQSGNGQRNVQHLLMSDNHLSSLHLDNTVDCLDNKLVAGTDSYNIMTVVGYRTGHSALLDTEAAY